MNKLTYFMVLVLAGCAGSPKVETETVDAKYVSLQNQLKVRGERMLCVQPDYLACYAVTQDECIEQSAPSTKECYAQTALTLGNINNELDKSPFLGSFAGCMMKNHIQQKQGNEQEIAICMQDATLDEQLGLDAMNR